MKKIFVLFSFLLIACNTTKSTTSNSILNSAVISETLNCPENGTCTIELIPNKNLEFKKDQFGNRYPIISDGDKTIFKFTFTKNPVKNTEDSSYTELIYAELNSSLNELSLVNEQLQTVKLHFGRLCFCKGETGYYTIKNGAFSLQKIASDSIKITIDFSIKEVPQLISKINETISLKSNKTN